MAGAYAYSSANSKPSPVTGAAAAAGNMDAPALAGLVVHLVGAVEHPGLHRMKRGDAMEAARLSGSCTYFLLPASCRRLPSPDLKRASLERPVS